MKTSNGVHIYKKPAEFKPAHSGGKNKSIKLLFCNMQTHVYLCFKIMELISRYFIIIDLDIFTIKY